jgi:TonB family protein
MNFSRRIFAVLAVALVVGPSVPAQDLTPQSKIALLGRVVEFDPIAIEMADRLGKAPRSKDRKLKVLAFVFQKPDGTTSRLGALLSQAFASALAQQISEIEFLEQSLITQKGQASGLTPREIADEDVALFLAQEVGASVFLFGTLEANEQILKVRISAVNAESRSAYYAADATIPLRKEWQGLDSVPVIELLPGRARGPATAGSLPVAGAPGNIGVSEPMCADCRPPNYSQAARDAKYEGTVVLKLIINAEGLAQNVRVVKALDYGLSERAILAVKNWKFKPAIGPNGKPVPVEVIIEVTFRLM